MKSTFGQSVIDFYEKIESPKVPEGVDLLTPFRDDEVKKIMLQFFTKFYNDNGQRVLLMGINPGRFGAGITGIGFTDPIRLKCDCGIENYFEQKAELSSIFIYEMISAYGGPEKFYQKFFFSALSPIGFVKQGKNFNYYDSKELLKEIKPYIVDWLKNKLLFGCSRKIAYCIGQGKNYKIFKEINNDYRLFDEIKGLPHPRWIMQYRLKKIDDYISLYIQELNASKTLIA